MHVHLLHICIFHAVIWNRKSIYSCTTTCCKITCDVAEFSLPTPYTIIAADRLSFLENFAWSWGTFLTANWQGYLNMQKTTLSLQVGCCELLWVEITFTWQLTCFEFCDQINDLFCRFSCLFAGKDASWKPTVTKSTTPSSVGCQFIISYFASGSPFSLK